MKKFGMRVLVSLTLTFLTLAFVGCATTTKTVEPEAPAAPAEVTPTEPAEPTELTESAEESMFAD